MKTSCSSWANNESLQAAANLRYTWALNTVIRSTDGLTLCFTQEVLMWLEQIIPSLEEKYEDFILFLLTSSHFDEGLAGFRFRI